MNMSKSDLSVRSDVIVSVKNPLMSVCISDINISNLDLSVNSDIVMRSDISVQNQIDTAF